VHARRAHMRDLCGLHEPGNCRERAMLHCSPTAAQLTVALIHPSELFCEGLDKLLQDTPYKLASYATCPRAPRLQRLLPAQGNFVFLVGGRNVTEIAHTVRHLRTRWNSAFVVVLGSATEPTDVMMALEAGADGYLRESTTFQTLIRAIELVAGDESVLPSDFVRRLRGVGAHAKEDSAPETFSASGAAALPRKVQLSVREESIIQGLVEGASNKVIAQRLSITEATVKVHVKAILRKIRAKNRTQAAIWAVNYLTLAQSRPHDLKGVRQLEFDHPSQAH
jgi:two-component system, NarL family, nitrate/nitrite response regulator NarL